MKKIWITIITVILVLPTQLYAERIKDITSIQGVRSNQLIGYGLVVGLNATGDQTNQAIFTAQSFKSLLNKFGIRIPPNVNLQTTNLAAVMVTAELPPFAKPGQTIDVTVSTLGNAKSLRGGTLLMTSLKGADNIAYAMAQGNLIVSGFGASGTDGSSITVNVPSVGRVPNGASVELPAPTALSYSDKTVFNLKKADFTTAVRMADVINRYTKTACATAIDGGSVVVEMPEMLPDQVALIAKIENLSLEPGQEIAKIIINARTGTVVITQNVVVKPAAISHGNLTVTISEDPNVSQPEPFSLGTTTVVNDSQVQASEDKVRAFMFDPGPNLEDVIEAINRVGATPSDLVAILDSLYRAGALEAEIEII